MEPGDSQITLRYERFGESITVEIPLPEVEPMSKQETPKREKLYVRRRWVLRRFAIFLLVLLAVNHFMQIGFLLPTRASGR